MCPEVAVFAFTALFHQGLDTLKYNCVFLVFPKNKRTNSPNKLFSSVEKLSASRKRRENTNNS